MSRVLPLRSALALLAAVVLPLALSLLLAFGAAAPAAAQGTPNYSEWSEAAERAEQAVAANRASDAALEDLRAEIARWRERFQAAQGTNEQRIETLRAQIQALGEPPETGAESPDITARRDELRRQLAELRAPVVAAEEAYSRADGLIREIDDKIRARQTDALLSLGPSPLAPAHWASAWMALRDSLGGAAAEVGHALGSDTQRREFRENLPLFLGLLALGALLLRTRAWIERFGARLRRGGRRGVAVWSFLVSIMQIVVPLVGIVALTEALFATGLFGLRSAVLLSTLPTAGAVLLGFWWLGDRLFPSDGDTPQLPLADEVRQEARWNVGILAVLVVAHMLLSRLAAFESFDDAARAVLVFPLILASGLLLFRLGQVLSQKVTAPGEANAEETPFRLQIVRMLGRAAKAVGLAGPAMAAVGYGAAGEALVFQSVLTLALCGLVLVLQGFLSDVYRYATRAEEGAGEALLPVLGAFLLGILALPVLALIWGARTADLTEIWARFREGFVLGEIRISPTDFLTFVVVFAIGLALTRLVQGALRSSVLPRTRMDAGGQTAVVSGTGYLGIFLAAIAAITSAGINLSALAYVAGALSVGIGFGLQNIVSNFVSGIILLIERPISKGDWIQVGDQMGYVRDISVRSTRIETFDRTDVIVPNADFISGVVTNWTRGNTVGRVIVPVGVAYGTDTRKVEQILTEIANAHPMVVASPPPSVLFRGFGDSSLNFEIRAILRDVNWVMSVHSDMNHEIAERFAQEGIEIPFPRRDLYLRGGALDLPGGGAEAQTAADDQNKAPSEGGDAGQRES